MIRLNKYALLFFLIVLHIILGGCGKHEPFEVTDLTIITTRPNSLSEWYQANLGFREDADHVLYQKGLTIRIKENRQAARPKEIKDKHGIPRIPGYYEFGFATNKFDKTIKKMKRNGVEFVTEPIYDKNFKQNTATVLDSDGNRIKLFQADSLPSLKPYFISVIVEDIGAQEKWYQMKFPVSKTINLDKPKDSLFIRILKGQEIAVELIQPGHVRVKDSIDYNEITGFKDIKLSGVRDKIEKDYEGNTITAGP